MRPIALLTGWTVGLGPVLAAHAPSAAALPASGGAEPKVEPTVSELGPAREETTVGDGHF